MTFDGIDLDVFWQNYGSMFTGKYDKRLLKNLLVPKATCNSWDYYSSDFELCFKDDYSGWTVYDGFDREEKHSKLYAEINRIVKVFKDICSDLDSESYDLMRQSFDYWYSAQHIIDEYSDCDTVVWRDEDGDWQSSYINKTYKW